MYAGKEVIKEMPIATNITPTEIAAIRLFWVLSTLISCFIHNYTPVLYIKTINAQGSSGYAL
jgi:hypothetical protein